MAGMQAELQRQLEATMLATIAHTEKQVRVPPPSPPVPMAHSV